MKLQEFFGEVVSEGLSKLETNQVIDIITFAESFLFNGDTVLYPTQKAILKAFYSTELTSDEEAILNEWIGEDKTTYVKDRKYSNLILECGRRGGKCLDVDTLIYTDKGMLRAGEIVDINGDEWQQLNLIISLPKNRRAKATKGFNNGFKSTIRIKTSKGYEINATPEHRIKTYNGDINWTYFKDIKLGDTACIERDINLWPEKDLLTKEEVKKIAEDLILYPQPTLPLSIRTATKFSVKLFLSMIMKEGALTYPYISFLKDLQCLLLNLGVTTTISGNRISLDGTLFWCILNGLYLPPQGYFYDEIVSINYEEAWTVDLSVPNYETYTAAGFTNHNTTLISIIVLYEFYKLITLESPAKHYKLLPNSPIAIFVISQSQEQVKETLFAQIVGYAKNSYFFKGLERTGKIEILIEEIRCREKNIGVYAKHTNSKSLVGYSLKVLVLDEASRFEMDEYGKSKADDIWENVAKGCAHRDAYLLTSEGYKTYGELFDSFDENNPPTIITYDPFSYKKGITDRVNLWDNGLSITYAITTESGKKEIITPEHPLLVWGDSPLPEWIEAKNLKVGMKVACPKCLDLFGSNSDINPCQAYLMGVKYPLNGLDDYHTIPSSILSSSKEVLGSFLKGIFSHRILISDSVSIVLNKSILEVIQRELLKFNIDSYIIPQEYLLRIKSVKEFYYFINDQPISQVESEDKIVNLNSNFYWESIESIEVLSESSTVGITVQDTGIIGNPILSHNTRTFGAEGKKIAISSAWEEGDYIEVLYDIACRHNASLGFRLATWQVNLSPEMSEESLKGSDSYIKDPIMAALEYEGIRAPKHGAFFIPSNVRAAMRGTSFLDAVQNPIDIQGKDLRHYVGVEITRMQSEYEGTSFMHTDYGIKKDSAATAICQLVRINDKWGIKVDGILVWKPYIDRDINNKGIKRIVSFLNVEEVLFSICSNKKVHMCSFDSYQSEYIIQKLHRSGIKTELMSTSIQAQLSYFTLLKNLIDQNLIILPCDSPWSSTLEYELVNLIQKPSGKIDHPRNSSKDLADAVANAVFNCYNYACSTGATFSINLDISSVNSKNSKSRISRPSLIPRNQAKNKLHKYNLV